MESPRSVVITVLPTHWQRNPVEFTSYLELKSWMLRRHVDDASEATLVETLHVAVQRDYEDGFFFAERLHRLNTEKGLTYGESALKGLFVERVHRAARATVREHNTVVFEHSRAVQDALSHDNLCRACRDRQNTSVLRT